MRPIRYGRSRLPGLLIRPPWTGGLAPGWAELVVDPIRQIEELARLRDRGLLSTDEFERQKAKVLDR